MNSQAAMLIIIKVTSWSFIKCEIFWISEFFVLISLTKCCRGVLYTSTPGMSKIKGFQRRVFSNMQAPVVHFLGLVYIQ